jgi:CHAT domain-containing protein
MHIKVFVLICISLLFSILLSGQCPDRDWLWKRLVFLRDSSSLSPSEKLNELHQYETRIENCGYKSDSTHALLLQRIGATYFFLADYLKAAQYMQRSIDIIAANTDKPFVNVKQNIGNYYRLGWIYDSLNNVVLKMKAVDSCIALARRFNFINDYYIKALYKKVEYFFDVGDYHRCIDYATICEKDSREYAGNNESDYRVGIKNALLSLLWKVNALLMLKNYVAAEELLTNRTDECKKKGWKEYLPTIYSQLAEVHLYNRDAKKALLDYKLALQYAKETGYNVGCKAILNNIGYKVYFEYLNDADNALLNCKKALSYINKNEAENVNDAFVSLNVLGYIANIYVRKGLFDSAYHYFQLALNQIKPGINEASLLTGSVEEFMKNNKVHYLSDLLIDKGNALINQYRTIKKIGLLNQAVRIYKIVDQLLDRIRAEQSELQSKLFWRSDSRKLYENAIEACYLQSDEKAAFYFFEKSRAVLLADRLREQRWASEDDIIKQAQLQKECQKLETQINNTDKSSISYSEKQKELFGKKQEMDVIQRRIKDQTPLYYQSYLDTIFTSLQEIRNKLLKDHDALVEIFSGDSAVYALSITAGKSKILRIDKPRFDSLSRLFISYVSDPLAANKNFDRFIDISSALYQLIFKDADLPPGRIIISPDGHYFPFEALIESRNNRQVKYFLEDHAVSYTYSARFLLNDFATNSTATGKNFMGIAPVNYPSAFSLASLPGSDRSLTNISSHFDVAMNLVASNATRNNFMNHFYEYKIIQLYTHASDSSKNDEPVIYFADSALYLSDLIGETKPLTRLIVLSACETGLGKEYKGEGIFSFNRGFAALGIPSSITNLWMADNESTYKLTGLFYKYIADGLPLDEALQKAKLEFIKTSDRERQLPYYWAAAILVGNTDSLQISGRSNWRYYTAIGIPVLLFILFIAIRKKRRGHLTPAKTETAG